MPITVEMKEACLRALTHSTIDLANRKHSVEMKEACFRVLTPVSEPLSRLRFWVEMKEACFRALTHTLIKRDESIGYRRNEGSPL